MAVARRRAGDLPRPLYLRLFLLFSTLLCSCPPGTESQSRSCFARCRNPRLWTESVSLYRIHSHVCGRSLCPCANHEGKPETDKHALEKDPGVIAPRESQEAKRNRDWIGLG